MTKLLYSILLITLALPTYAQTVSEVNSRQVGEKIEVTYSLDKRADITAYYSPNQKTDFRQMNSVTGDVGKKIAPGKGKRIVWNVLSDVDALTGDQIVFKVEAKGYNKPVVGTEYFSSMYFGGCLRNAAAPEVKSSVANVGLMLGVIKKVGWYASICGNASSRFEEESITEYFALTTGCMVRLYRGFIGYAGTGIVMHTYVPLFASKSGSYDEFKFKSMALDFGFTYIGENIGLVYSLGSIMSFKGQSTLMIYGGLGVRLFKSRKHLN